MKIPPRTYGGIELLVKLLCDDLTARGHEVTLFAPGDAQTAAKLRPVCDENITDMMANDRVIYYETYVNGAVADVLQAQGDFDVIHFHVGNQWVPFGSLAKTPVLFTLHTQPNADDEWALARHPQVPVAGISRFQAQSIAALRSREVPVIYNGCDFDAFEPSFEPGKYLAFLGRMNHDKNPLDAIRIAEKIGMPIVLAGAAQQPQEQRYFEEKIKALIDGANVRYLGPVNHAQKNKLLREAAALLFPVQWAEPFGLVMIEAMACGTPVVAHNLGSISEVVEQGVTGFHADSIDEMSALVPKALALDRANVREQAKRRFCYQRMVEDYLKLYRSLLA